LIAIVQGRPAGRTSWRLLWGWTVSTGPKTRNRETVPNPRWVIPTETIYLARASISLLILIAGAGLGFHPAVLALELALLVIWTRYTPLP